MAKQHQCNYLLDLGRLIKTINCLFYTVSDLDAVLKFNLGVAGS